VVKGRRVGYGCVGIAKRFLGWLKESSERWQGYRKKCQEAERTRYDGTWNKHQLLKGIAWCNEGELERGYSGGTKESRRTGGAGREPLRGRQYMTFPARCHVGRNKCRVQRGKEGC